MTRAPLDSETPEDAEAPTFAVIFPAAGRSTRFADPSRKKVVHEIAGRSVWIHAVAPFVERPDVVERVVVVAPEDVEGFTEAYRAVLRSWRIRVVAGGAERFESVARGLAHLESSATHVAIHDAARPCLDPDDLDRLFRAARTEPAVVLGHPVSDTLKRVEVVEDGRITICETLDRAAIYAVQTPQVARRSILERAYAERGRLVAEGATITDDLQLVEALGHRCRVVPGSRWNLKVTYREDLAVAEALRADRGSLPPDIDDRRSVV